jgi:hypothetical protein
MITKDEIIEMACQAFGGVIKKEERDNFIIFAKLVEAKERIWVGLTDEEIEQVYMETMNFQKMARALEAKLKDKNT